MNLRTLSGAVVVAWALLRAGVAAAEIPDPMPAADGGVPDALPPAPPVAAPPPPPVAAPIAPSATEFPVEPRSPLLVEPPSPWIIQPPNEVMRARWQTSLYGFVELNGMHDATQSYGPSTNNVMLARPGTYAGQHGRTQLTANNSLFGFVLTAPTLAAMQALGHVEVDFFGVQPTDATESTIYTTPSVRMRLFYLRLRKSILGPAYLELLAGQYHDLFAWGGAGFYPHSIAFLGIAGEVYHREPQIRLTASIPFQCATIDVAAAAVRPVQRDSQVPDVQGGVKVAIGSWKGIGAQGFGQPEVHPAAFGVSGVWRRFAVAEFLPVPGDPKIAFGHGFAANAFLPIIPAKKATERENALSLNAELTIGTGISDLYTGLTGGALFPTLPNPAGLMPAPLYRPNIDSGIVTYDANGNLQPINWRAIVVGFQYYLPVAEGKLWVSGNYSQLKSTNIVSLTPENSRGGVFFWQQYVDGNVYAAVHPAVHLGLSYQYTEQVFGDRPFGGANPRSHNHRGELGMRMFF